MVKKIKKDDKVKVEYTGKLKDGTVFDTTDKLDKPLEVDIGNGKIIPAFEEQLIGMKEGEVKKIEIPSEKAYGQPDSRKIQKIPRDKLPSDKEIKTGMMVGIGLPNGQKLPAKIKKVTDKEVTLDLNHPLAGKDLTFEIKVVGIN